MVPMVVRLVPVYRVFMRMRGALLEILKHRSIVVATLQQDTREEIIPLWRGHQELREKLQEVARDLMGFLKFNHRDELLDKRMLVYKRRRIPLEGGVVKYLAQN